MTTERPIDYAPLREQWSSGTVFHFAEKLRRRPEYAHWGLTRGALWFPILSLAVLSAFWIATIWTLVDGTGRSHWSAAEILAYVFGLLVVLVIYLGLAFWVLESVFVGDRRLALIRLLEFCKINGLQYLPVADSDYPGRRFAGVFVRDEVRAPDGSFTYGMRAVPGKQGHRSTGIPVGWFLAVPLERPLPHMVLAAPGSPLDAKVDGVRLSLEGDFDRHFDLVVPSGYERDALYVFTPDLMALLIDHAAGCSAEVVDDHVLFYPPFPARQTVLDDEEFHRTLIGIAGTVGRKAASRSVNYRDDRSDAPNHRIGADGRRLRHVVTIGSLALPLLIGVVPLLVLLGGAILEGLGL